MGTTDQGTKGTISANSAEPHAAKAKENPLETLNFQGILAEAVGFEPTSPCGLPDFESGPL